MEAPHPGVQAVVDAVAQAEEFVVISDHEAQPSDDRIQSGSFRATELLVVQVRVVHHGRDLVEGGIGQIVLEQDTLERAAPLVMAELHPAHVERCATELFGRLWIRSKGEAWLGVNEASNEPGAGSAVDVWVGPSDPEHGPFLPGGWRPAGVAG